MMGDTPSGVVAPEDVAGACRPLSGELTHTTAVQGGAYEPPKGFLDGENGEARGTENWAPLPRVFHHTNELGSVRHECELQGVMTS